MLVIGERINATNKAVAEAIGKRDSTFIQQLASAQVAAGADYIDVNAGRGHAEYEAADMEWLTEIVQDVIDKPLVIDSADPKVIEARDYFFGAQTETYIDLSTGRDIILNPQQKAGPLNYFMYPYAEVNGEPLDFISQEYLKYIITFD